jgi:UDP:flavonoid glycosyltransferase YjiC (YdhE family)
VKEDVVRPTVLFIADAVTLAHVARPASLAQGMDLTRFNVILACDPRYQTFLEGLPFQMVPIRSISSEQFLRAAASGSPLYDTATLREYVRDDLQLLASVRPDAVVGDHRLSLAISARVATVPYLAIINAYWSPYADLVSPLPELPMNRWLGTAIAQRIFNLAWPLASAYHSLPLNRLRHEYGLSSIGWDWRHPYTNADRTLYADASELVPTHGLPKSHSYLGPVQWSPPVALPSWWDDLPADRPVIYATLGSSGHSRLLGLVLEALSDMPVTVIATLAGKATPGTLPPNARLLDYAPGDKVAARAAMVICNGGSLTVYQALAAGKPIIGIAAHMDQHLSMRYAERAGVGMLLRSETLDCAKLRMTVEQMLTNAHAKRLAQDMARSISAYAPAQRLTEVLDEVVGHVTH